MSEPLFPVEPRPLRAEWYLERSEAAESAAPLPALWDHQAAAIAQIDEALDAGETRIVVKIPTGGGKTRLASEFILQKKYIEAGARVGFWMPRLDLVEQTIRAFREAGIPHVGVIQGKHRDTDATAPVQVCSEQTLTRRTIPTFDLIFIDECHLQFRKILKWIDDPKLQSVPVIGLSATPWSKGLGKHYRHLINPTSIKDLVEKKILCSFVVFAPLGPDLSNVRTIAGDYHEGDLSAACDTKVLVANIVTTWQARSENRPTILFAIDRKHAKHLEKDSPRPALPANMSTVKCRCLTGRICSSASGPGPRKSSRRSERWIPASISQSVPASSTPAQPSRSSATFRAKAVACAPRRAKRI